MIPGNEEVESAALLEVGQDSYLRHECSFKLNLDLRRLCQHLREDLRVCNS